MLNLQVFCEAVHKDTLSSARLRLRVNVASDDNWPGFVQLWLLLELPGGWQAFYLYRLPLLRLKLDVKLLRRLLVTALRAKP